MSDFASLLGKFQQTTQTLSSKNSTSSRKNRVDEEELPSRKRTRLLNASDFPPVEKIFLICPAGVQTGGPEAMHQLCDKLNETTSIPAYMVYAISDGGNNVTHASKAKIPAAYLNYKAPSINYDPFRDGSSSCLMVWPECWTDEMMNYLAQADNPTPCAIWWLSVNNNTRRFQDWDRKDIIHFHQSEYAKTHLLENGATNVMPMTEYISNPPEPDASVERTIDVLFNPLKGVHYTDEIRKRSGWAMKFQPIGGGPEGRVRIPPAEVRELLKKAKIYIDFGPHPGMDRLPREAALAGCLVVTNMEGAASYQEDVPLPAKYKVRKFDPETIHRLLKDLLQNFDERKKDLDEYRCWIRDQKERMNDCISNLVTELVTKRAKKVQ